MWNFPLLGQLALNFVVSMVGLFVAFVVCMWIVKHRKALKEHPLAYLASGVFVLLSIALDVAVNMTWGCVIFLERPRGRVLTERLIYHHLNSEGWRWRLADRICRLLNRYDPDGHC